MDEFEKKARELCTFFATEHGAYEAHSALPHVLALLREVHNAAVKRCAEWIAESHALCGPNEILSLSEPATRSVKWGGRRG